MHIDTNCLLKRNPDIVSSEIDGETVMMDKSFEKYFGMKDIATRIWHLLENETSLQQLCKQLTTEYEVSFEQCLKDVEPFICELIKQDMVNMTEPVTGG